MQGIDVCLQNHHGVFYPKFYLNSLLQTYVPLEACIVQVNGAL